MRAHSLVRHRKYDKRGGSTICRLFAPLAVVILSEYYSTVTDFARFLG